MLKLTRKTEYALLALRRLAQSGEALLSVREISAHYRIPEPLLAKVMQRLKKAGVVTSTKGAMGGYTLGRPLEQILLTDILVLFDEQLELVDCIINEDSCGCEQMAHCDIRQPLEALNTLLMAQVAGVNLQSFFLARTDLVGGASLSIGRSMSHPSA